VERYGERGGWGGVIGGRKTGPGAESLGGRGKTEARKIVGEGGSQKKKKREKSKDT